MTVYLWLAATPQRFSFFKANGASVTAPCCECGTEECIGFASNNGTQPAVKRLDSGFYAQAVYCQSCLPTTNVKVFQDGKPIAEAKDALSDSPTFTYQQVLPAFDGPTGQLKMETM
jgi:hypothetical protein